MRWTTYRACSWQRIFANLALDPEQTRLAHFGTIRLGAAMLVIIRAIAILRGLARSSCQMSCLHAEASIHAQTRSRRANANDQASLTSNECTPNRKASQLVGGFLGFAFARLGFAFSAFAGLCRLLRAQENRLQRARLGLDVTGFAIVAILLQPVFSVGSRGLELLTQRRILRSEKQTPSAQRQRSMREKARATLGAPSARGRGFP